MKTLILTCNTGEGHNSSAAAIKEVFESYGECCELCDSLKFSSGMLSSFIAFGHVYLYRHLPWLFDKGYKVTQRKGSFFKKDSFLYKLLTSGYNKLHEYIVSNNFEAVVCVHPFAALLVTEMRRKFGIVVPAYLVATDYSCVPSTADSDMDVYFIPHESIIEEFKKCGIPGGKLVASGIPVKQCFFEINTTFNARELLGLPLNKKIVLMCCGSMGCGPMKKIASDLRKNVGEDTLIIVICGNNNKLYNCLIKYQSENFYVLGFTDKMHLYMLACDVFITKPGGVSTTECITLSKPMVFIDAVGGCERGNLDFFKKCGCAVTVSMNNQVPSVTIDLLNDSEKLRQISDTIKTVLGRKNGAEFIYSHLTCEKAENSEIYNQN